MVTRSGSPRWKRQIQWANRGSRPHANISTGRYSAQSMPPQHPFPQGVPKHNIRSGWSSPNPSSNRGSRPAREIRTPPRNPHRNSTVEKEEEDSSFQGGIPVATHQRHALRSGPASHVCPGKWTKPHAGPAGKFPSVSRPFPPWLRQKGEIPSESVSPEAESQDHSSLPLQGLSIRLGHGFLGYQLKGPSCRFSSSRERRAFLGRFYFTLARLSCPSR